MYGDYVTYGGDYDTAALGAGLAAFGVGIWIVTMVIGIFMIVCLWKIFTKNGKPGWHSIVPILNMWSFFTISDLPGWLCIIPGVNAVCLLIAIYKLAIKMGKSSGIAILCVLLPIVGYPILAFSKTEMPNNGYNPNMGQPMNNGMYNNPNMNQGMNQPMNNGMGMNQPMNNGMYNDPNMNNQNNYM